MNPRPLPERLNARNSRLWKELTVFGVGVRFYLASRTCKTLHELHDGRLGWFDGDTSVVLIGWDLPDDVAETIFIHELKHAEIFHGGVKLHPDHEIDDDEEEQIVNALACADYAALKGNGMLVFPPRPKLPKGARK